MNFKEFRTHFLNWLNKPENSKTIAKIGILIFISIIGLAYSVNIMAYGLDLLVECGIPETTLKLAVGVVCSIGGFVGIVLSIAKPVLIMFKMFYTPTMTVKDKY